MGTDVDLLKHPVVSAAVGTAVMAVGAAEAAYRVAEKVPVFGPLMRRGVVGLSERGDKWVTQRPTNSRHWWPRSRSVWSSWFSTRWI
jgi:hypothetical protein